MPHNEEAALTEARRAHESALREIADATTAFDLEGTPAAAKKLQTAREKATLAAEFVARAERLLTSAREREAAERRAALEAELAELEKQLEHDNVRRLAQPLLDREVDLLVQLVAVRTERELAERRLSDVSGRADRIRQQLDQPPNGRRTFTLASRHGIVQAFRLTEWPTDLERRMAEALEREISR
jgi:hypothetical protein